MKIYEMAQYSADWYALHIGKPSSSRFDDILTPAKLELSKSRKRYMYQLVAERLLNQPMESVVDTEWMQRGLALEPIAAKAYEFDEEIETKKVGIITTDNGRIVCSPDRLVIGKNRALEIKCPSPAVHVQYMAEDFGDAYKLQVQGQMLVGEFDEVDRFSYNEYMPHVKFRTTRDKEVIQKLSNALDQFCDECDALYEKLHAWGYFQEYKKAPSPHDVELGNILNAG